MYKKDKVSIIIPIYNGEKHLAECLDTIQNQTYTNLEIICINDGSRDKSLSILKEYQKKDDRFIVIDQKNAGQSKARNEGIRRASGKYISFVDCAGSCRTARTSPRRGVSASLGHVAHHLTP